jgi:hypothetical protein
MFFNPTAAPPLPRNLKTRDAEPRRSFCSKRGFKRGNILWGAYGAAARTNNRTTKGARYHAAAPNVRTGPDISG